jgi:imidazolonepropionase-like amidohydrolase
MLAIQAPLVFDGERMLTGGALVLIDGGKIAGVEPRMTPVPDGCPVHVLDGMLLPGLIDAHAHLCADARPGALERLGETDGTGLAAVIEESLRAHLRAGVTTVRDLGDWRDTVLAWRAGATRDLPTVVASGTPITSTGGHCWTLGGQAAGEHALRAAVQQRAGAGADVIKIMASGGVFTPGTDTTRPQFTDAEMAAAVTEAHALGLPVTAHAHALTAVVQAVRAGVDGIEHCSCVTPAGARLPGEVAAELADAGIAVCATLGSDPSVVVPPEILAMAAAAGITEAALQAVTAGLHAAGVRIVAGSDGGLGPAKPHGLLPRTLDEYVRSGIPAPAALAAATSAAADACRLTGRKGRIRPGHDADLLAVPADPTVDITALLHPQTVYLAGQPVEHLKDAAVPGCAGPHQPTGQP